MIHTFSTDFDSVSVHNNLMSLILEMFDTCTLMKEYTDYGVSFRFVSANQVLLYKSYSEEGGIQTDMVMVTKNELLDMVEPLDDEMIIVSDGHESISVDCGQAVMVLSGKAQMATQYLGRNLYCAIDGKDNLLLYDNNRSVCTTLPKFRSEVRG